MLNRHTTEWKGPFLGFTAIYEGVTATCSQGITAITQGNCLSLLWNIARLGGNFPELSHASAWHSSWVTYWLPFFISWKMGCSSPVQVPYLDISCSRSPPWTCKLRAAVRYSWAVQEHFENWIAPSFAKSPLLWIRLKPYSPTKGVRLKCVWLPSLFRYKTRTLCTWSPTPKCSFSSEFFSVLHSACYRAGVPFLP